MLESQNVGVQGKSCVRPIGMFRDVWSVAAIADDRMIGFGEMDSDLVAAAGIELHSDERRVGQSFIDGEVRDGVFAAVGVLNGIPAESFAGGEVTFVLAGVVFHHAGDECEINAVGCSQAQLILQGSGNVGLFREDQQTGGLAVEPMHDERSDVIAEVSRDLIDERP